MALCYRLAEPEDLCFVLESFLDSFKSSHAAGLISMDDWRGVMFPQLSKLLSRPTVEIWVAYNPEARSTQANIYGWLAHEKGWELPYVIYCYVKLGYRKKGLARRLFKKAGIEPAAPFEYAAKTSMLTRKRLRAAIPMASWKPLRIRRNTPETRSNSVKEAHDSERREPPRGVAGPPHPI